MGATSRNSTSPISSLLAIVLLWLFRPILSPAMTGINTFITFPIYILFAVVSSVGEMVLFSVSAYTMVQCVKDRVKIFKYKTNFDHVENEEIDESRHLNNDVQEN